MLTPEQLKIVTDALDDYAYANDIDTTEIIDVLEALPVAPRADWSQAPESAQWAIVNVILGIRSVHFSWLFLEDEPELRHGMYRFKSQPVHGGMVELPIGIDWRAVKEKRPQEEITP